MLSKIHLFWRRAYGYHNKLYTTKVAESDLIEQSTSHTIRENVNFDRTTGLMTEIIVNGDFDNDGPFFDYNYLLDVTRNQRWFITGVSQTRSGQFRYMLVRDVFSDFYGDIEGCPAIINKANQITDATKLAQYKKTMNLSQIKKGEIVLEDGAGKGWVYVYLAKNAQMISSDGYFKIPKASNAWNTTITLTDSMISDLSKPLLVMDDMEIYFRGLYEYGYLFWANEEKKVFTSNKEICTNYDNDFNGNVVPFFNMTEGFPSNEEVLEYVKKHYEEYLAYVKDSGNYIINDTYNALVGMNGQVIADSSNNLYVVNVTEVPSLNGSYTTIGTEEQAKTMADAFGWTIVLGKKQPLNFNVKGKAYSITFTSVKNTNDYYYRIPIAWINNRATTLDCLYDIMAFPIECNVMTDILNNDGTSKSKTTIFTSYAETINFVQALKTAMGDSVYDIQWLPYGPFSADTSTTYGNYYNLPSKVNGKKTKAVFKNEEVETSTTEDGTTTTSGGKQVSVSNVQANQVLDGSVVDESGNVTSNVAWINLTGQNASRTISRTIAIYSDDYLANRIENEETFYRLCGPNWNSAFEFSAVNNGGFKGYTIDMTLKPYNPFVRIQPIFGKMYGSNFNDPRGLILKGDFSIEQSTEAYRNYQLSNRNYDLIFNRQLQSLDRRNSVAQRTDEISSAMDVLGIFTGGVKGASSGAMIGASTGSVAGSAIGAGVGAVTGVATGIADLYVNNEIRDMNKSLRMDAKDAAIKQYQYQLGNIVALPDTLSRSSSFDAMYRVYPVLEIYSCSDEEKTQLTQSIRWNGIDINQISTIGEQIENGTGELYISATLLRTIDMSDQVYGAISQLLADGIYIERD